MNTYLSITIGPIYKTIAQARATRQIWASSFIFSLLMKEILKHLAGHNKVAKILNPSADSIKINSICHGAGIYPDRCHVKLKERFTDDDLRVLRKTSLNNLPVWTINQKEKYFHIYAVQTVFSESSEESPLKYLNEIMDSIELQQKFIQSGEQNIIRVLEKNIKNLYERGMCHDDPIFLTSHGDKRLPSIIELSTSEYKSFPDYDKMVTQRVWESLRKSKEADKLWDETEDDILMQLQKNIDSFKLRSKYFAIVLADGDNIRARIQELGNNAINITNFSDQLFRFSKAAIEKVVSFGALPVYFGGDDMFFVAPLVNEKNETIFDLIDQLDECFSCELGDNNSISYGVSISYYKYPMGDVRKTAYELLVHSAKKLDIDGREKNAITFQVRKHSGQTFGAILPKEKTSYASFRELLKKYHNNLEESFLSSLIYTLTEHRFLFFKAVADGNEAHFFEHHFNESVHQNNQFLVDVREFVGDLFQDFRGVNVQSGWEIHGNIKKEEDVFSIVLYACLRLIQFLNAKDHG